ncbi:NTF2 fold immunity protein [Arcticibacter tournemirensis]
MKSNYFFISLLALLLSFSTIACQNKAKDNYNWNPKDGYVPDEKTAVAIAEIISERVYGRQVIINEKPFKATLITGQIWAVRGTPPAALGGALYMEIQKADGKILKVIHGR